MNLRPSGYEVSDQDLSPYQCVPDSALELGIRRSVYAGRANSYTPVPRRTVEGTVEAWVANPERHQVQPPRRELPSGERLSRFHVAIDEAIFGFWRCGGTASS